MESIRLDVISIGTLSRNRLWNEGQPVRTPHATTTLIRAGKRTIIVDPGLPPSALGARLFERTGLTPDARVTGRFRATGVRPKCAERLRSLGLEFGADMFDHVQMVA